MRCLYIERGAFRMRSASLSMQGLNARFSLEQARSLETIEGMSADALDGARAQEPWLRLRFLRFLVANEAACRAAPRRRFLQHKRFALMPYARLALAQWWTAHHTAQPGRRPARPGGGRPARAAAAATAGRFAVQTALAIRRQPGAARLRRPAGAPRRARRARARQTPSDGQRALPSARRRALGGWQPGALLSPQPARRLHQLDGRLRGRDARRAGDLLRTELLHRQRCGDPGYAQRLRRASGRTHRRAARPGARARAAGRRAALVSGAGRHLGLQRRRPRGECGDRDAASSGPGAAAAGGIDAAAAARRPGASRVAHGTPRAVGASTRCSTSWGSHAA